MEIKDTYNPQIKILRPTTFEEWNCIVSFNIETIAKIYAGTVNTTSWVDRTKSCLKIEHIKEIKKGFFR